jgi:FkbM family methyltransferase
MQKINETKKIAIYGAGTFGKIFYEALNKKINFFIDDFSINDTYLNKPIKKLDDVSQNTTIYISALQYSKKIEGELLSKGYTNVINFTKSIMCIPNILEEISHYNYLWLISDKSKMLNEEKLNKVVKLLKDEKSKTILHNIINLRKTFDIKYYINPIGTEYFPNDVPILKNLEQINFIDCGAYIGDTIDELMKQNKNINSTISFEPDKKNLSKLNIKLSRLKDKFPDTNFLVYPAGAYSKNAILKFSNNGIDSSASFNDNSTLQVPVVSLDSVILNSNPNYIKMDIEGAEKEAIIGAKKTIQKHKPNLAICLYHKAEDLWELPLLINEIEPSYDMYVRVHEDLCLSTVLYCISKENRCIN